MASQTGDTARRCASDRDSGVCVVMAATVGSDPSPRKSLPTQTVSCMSTQGIPKQAHARAVNSYLLPVGISSDGGCRMVRGLFLAGVFIVGVAMAPVAQAAGPYNNCSQAKADGVCNIPENSPYYQPKLDRDGDGIACEC